jgi:hypothetical protein
MKPPKTSGKTGKAQKNISNKDKKKKRKRKESYAIYIFRRMQVKVSVEYLSIISRADQNRGLLVAFRGQFSEKGFVSVASHGHFKYNSCIPGSGGSGYCVPWSLQV